MAFIKKKPKTVKIPPIFENIGTTADVLRYAEKQGIETDPLDVSQLTKALGIKMYFEPMKGEESGSLKKHKKTGEWHMTVNSLHHPHRQRFTIAHEIGHHVQHGAFKDEFIDTNFFRNGDSNKMEAEANSFAAELLMPKDKFDRFISDVSSKTEDIASHFQVSSMAVRIRAKELGYQGHNL
jgi:Zn-dependent peptidase ImmA (M78 family)|tara:strand:- start:4622 stop:5164 length:543 start_codon:yes stop_codon:yes gene_type:complete